MYGIWTCVRKGAVPGDPLWVVTMMLAVVCVVSLAVRIVSIVQERARLRLARQMLSSDPEVAEAGREAFRNQAGY
ncbi:hypothetical protein EDF18_0267 [Frigoribacterium sp. PhB107]|uniref:hypothetical protein n=1 Tax=Frigoribacterium sp. PhB107 TaxID=2485172 RepID=UPI000F46D15A|nr:hypothetical protein [Frigoribacterium sp. PhB107]ROP77638.1 hypothetical protein EDF18_0267 [Frigoribacterium sp. PhB107]